jgi:predicted nucleotidyltransferase
MFENNEFDLSGWDLRKSLNLMWKSNAPLLERIQSPILYIANEEFLSEINLLAQETYSKIATMHHYLSMAKKMFEEIKDDENVKLKKLFYALRAAIACKWIVEREEIPPIVFQEMLEKLPIDKEIKLRIYELISLKSVKEESYLHPREEKLNTFINELISYADEKSASLPASKGDIEQLNSFFIKTLFSK